MWSSRLFWKLFLVYAGFNITLAAGFLIVVTVWQKTQVDRQNERILRDSAVVFRSHVKDLVATAVTDQESARAARGELQELVKELSEQTELRLTLVASDGDVLADSQRNPEKMLNHADRPELIDATTNDMGIAKRHSSTLGVDMLYLALPIRRGDETVAFVRVALETQTINERFTAIRTFLWLFAFAVGLAALVLTYAMVGRIIRPLSQLTLNALAIASGEDKQDVEVRSKDEVGLLATAFNQMQSELTDRMTQLQDNSQLLSTVLSSMDEGILAVDANENVLMANEASSEQLGFVTDDVLGRPLIEATRNLALTDAIQQTLKTQRTYSSEFESLGEPRRTLALRATRLPGDPCPGVVVVLHDVSELRRLENLRQEFVANVSHELKTPLSSIKAYAETLRLGAINDAENNVRFVERIEQEADRLHELILDMLRIAQVEAGQQSFEITKVIVDESVRASVDAQHEVAAEKNIHLKIDAPAEPLAVQADEDGLRAILDNLINNAIKYTGDGGDIAVRWHEDGQQVVIEVEDTGIGIAAKDQPRVFERFFRVDKARSREMGGTGLGLSIVKHLAQSFGGSVAVESEIGKGSTFQVRLPLSIG